MHCRWSYLLPCCGSGAASHARMQCGLACLMQAIDSTPGKSGSTGQLLELKNHGGFWVLHARQPCMSISMCHVHVLHRWWLELALHSAFCRRAWLIQGVEKSWVCSVGCGCVLVVSVMTLLWGPVCACLLQACRCSCLQRLQLFGCVGQMRTDVPALAVWFWCRTKAVAGLEVQQVSAPAGRILVSTAHVLMQHNNGLVVLT